VSLVDSVRKAQSSVSEAFDQLVQDIEADKAVVESPDGGSTKLVKLTAEYSDGSTVDFIENGADTVADETATPVPPVPVAEGEGEGVKDLTNDAPKSDGQQTTPEAENAAPGNAEQL
jgi:hypothetical protein